MKFYFYIPVGCNKSNEMNQSLSFSLCIQTTKKSQKSIYWRRKNVKQADERMKLKINKKKEKLILGTKKLKNLLTTSPKSQA